MATAPGYAATPTVGAALLTTGDTSRTAPVTYATIFTPGASGGLVERISVEPLATTTSTVVRIFLYDGSNFHLYAELALQVQTAAGGTPIAPQTMEAVTYPTLFPIVVPTNWTLRATINDNQTGVKVIAQGGSL